MKTAQVKCQGDSMGIRLSYTNWTVSQRQTESGRTLTTRINHNRSVALERSVINYWGLKPVFTLQQPHPRFCCGSCTHRGCSARVKDLYSSINRNSEHINQDSSLKWNKMCTQHQTNSETLEQLKSNNRTRVGPTKDRLSFKDGTAGDNTFYCTPGNIRECIFPGN